MFTFILGCFIYNNFYLEKGQCAIIYIKGNAKFDWDGFTNEQLVNFERQCAYYLINLQVN